MSAPKDSQEKARRQRIIKKLGVLYPDAKCALKFGNPFELLIATILSAQSTDKTVNEVTPALFQKYPTPATLAGAETQELENLIHATGFFRNKARSLSGCARELVARHGGEVPSTMEELVALPGVGRKTANVVLGNAFGKSEGVVVDTHVQRVSQRLQFTQNTTAEKIELDLMESVPHEQRTFFANALIHHGRQVCVARKPKCEICDLAPDCPFATGQ